MCSVTFEEGSDLVEICEYWFYDVKITSVELPSRVLV